MTKQWMRLLLLLLQVSAPMVVRRIGGVCQVRLHHRRRIAVHRQVIAAGTGTATAVTVVDGWTGRAGTVAATAAAAQSNGSRCLREQQHARRL